MFNIFKHKNIRKQSFTYFLPSPPERSTPYQERSLDQITQHLNKNNINYEVVSTATNSKGMWIILDIFGQEASLTPFLESIQDKINKTSAQSDDLELYYEDHEEFHNEKNFKA